jgi:hypothetical protein
MATEVVNLVAAVMETAMRVIATAATGVLTVTVVTGVGGTAMGASTGVATGGSEAQTVMVNVTGMQVAEKTGIGAVGAAVDMMIARCVAACTR